MLATKGLLQAAASDRTNPDAANMRESFTQSRRFASGIPAERFAKIARKELRHKL
jgi:peroxisomal 3,2-trans-enoyl-CoA isomerase